MTAGRSRRFWRRLVLGIPTLLGLAPKGFFIPYRYAGMVAAAGARPPYAAIESLFRAREETFRALLGTIDDAATALEAIGIEPPAAPRWCQDWFPRLDAAAAYVLLRKRRPARIVEVGAGHSTRFFARAVEDGGLATRITAIDPAPRAALERVSVTVERRTVQEAGEAVFGTLGCGDVLSIDSSHVLMPGTDVDILFNRVLPTLPAGVLVHVHDVFLPDDYPEEWAWRGYNEQLAVAALLAGGGWQVQWSSRYVATRLAAQLRGTVVERLRRAPGAYESSLWLERA